ncbi:hypothetical protein JRQ81_013116 [Phrynocephalus forsythii]|uniref:Ectopic P granules protein 5 homolog n=1 Tax=Phrynocephalus forsythii TaxID=171643 RepID=A0A9Q1B4G3_9SAUR|nr:hypothetical protein JRQ81_013116 [Phrynocephalus forsythii]
MAEALRPRSRAKTSRGKTKEKKPKCEEEERVPSQPPLPSTCQGGVSQSVSPQLERLLEPERCTQGKQEKDVKDVPPKVCAVDCEGSPAALLSRSPTQGEESKEEGLQRGKDVAENRPSEQSSLPEAATSSFLKSTIPSAPSLMGHMHDPAAKNECPAKHLLPIASTEVPDTPSVAPKEHVQSSGFKMLYPKLPLELFGERLSELSLEPPAPKARLYPQIPVEPELSPFTKEQLKVFEPGSWLENVDVYVEEFGSLAHQDRHEFFELLLNYCRCRKQLLLAEAELQALISDAQNAKGRLWVFKDEHLSVQGVCADQCKVSGHHRYQTVSMNEGALEDLKHLFESQTEHVHQKLALHLYTSTLSRLQVESYLYRLLSGSPLLKSLAIQQEEPGAYVPEKTTPQEMMKVFAFANSLLELLAVGLETFNRARYRQFVKRIGHLIRMTLCYVSDHWTQYVHRAKGHRYVLPPYSVEKLQVEFDELFLRAVLHVLKAKRLGVWLFMSEMPYGTLSGNMLWKLFFLMHCSESEDLETLSATVPLADCKRHLKDPAHLESFTKCLQAMNGSEEICLLTTFAQMAQTKRDYADEDFVKVIVLEIYEVSYVSLSTRETFSKVGRELLGAITAVHTSMISVLLDRVRETIEKVGMVSLYLFKELPMHLWKPSAQEVALLRDWLLNYNLSEVENKLACVILEGLNWGAGENGCLHLDPVVHAEVALMVLEAYQKYLSQKPYGGLISESLKQVSYLASVVRYGETPETSFNQWAWGLVLRIKLHMNDLASPQGWPSAPVAGTVLDLGETPTFHPLLKASRSGLPIGCYLVVAMTTVGHSIEKFCSDGISLLNILVQSRHLRTVVHVLDKILPLFYPCQYYLLKNEQFLLCLQQFLQLDSGVPQGMTQQVTQKVAQHLTGTSYGENIKLLSCMIQSHVFISSHPNGVGPAAVLEFWVQALTSQALWHKDRAILSVMDHLCQAAFQFNQEDCVQKLLYQQHKNALGYHCDKGLLSSLVSWIVAGNVTPSFTEGSANPSQIWLAWTVLNMESIFEEDSQLRRVVERELVTNSSTPDQALKKAQSQLKLPIVPSLQRLLIYRWAQQALATPADHPLLPLIWQKFFLLYLHRPGPQYGLPVDGCIGKRFFQSPAHLSLLSSLKQRLTEVADFHHAASKALRLDSPARGTESSLEKWPGKPDYLTSPELHKELVRLFNTFILWLEEESFQKGDIYIPSLPKQYDTHRLAKIMQNQQDLWIEFVDIERIQHGFQEALDFWFQGKIESHVASSTGSAQTDFTDPCLAKERILSSLKKYDLPQSPLPLQLMKAPVPVIASASLVSPNEAKDLTRANLRILQQHAKSAALRESQQVAFNNEMLDTLPKLFTNREEQVTLSLECRGSSGKSCQGAALVAIQFEGKHRNEAINQQLHVLEKEVEDLQAEATKLPSLGVVEAAVHMENFITALINLYKRQPVPGIHRVGINLFFSMVEFVCEETQRHPPTRQFFTSCIEILGQVFIAGTKSECWPVLQTILKNRRLCTLLSPYFTPAAAPEEFVRFLISSSGCRVQDPGCPSGTRLLEAIHLALKACGFEPEEEVLMPFSIFCKHWTGLLRYQFPDHYSSFLRLLMQSCMVGGGSDGSILMAGACG